MAKQAKSVHEVHWNILYIPSIEEAPFGSGMSNDHAIATGKLTNALAFTEKSTLIITAMQ